MKETTLAQSVYSDDRVKEQFELTAWVTVSGELDVFNIIKSLLQHIGVVSHTQEWIALQGELQEALRGKKFLFVFDDVRDEDYDKWDLLKSNFAVSNPKSKIIVTTRNDKVCTRSTTRSNQDYQLIHELKLLSITDCWNIFVHHAFDGDDKDLKEQTKLEEIGKKIVYECKGLPSAVKDAGALLRFDRDPKTWETILSSQDWSKNPKRGVRPSLWQSYKYLPSTLKQCFALCAIFPQDHEFNRKELVLLWMAVDLLPDAEKSLEEVGDEYFNVLISRSFFQRSSSRKPRYVMHNLMHDLATFVLSQFGLSLCEDTKASNISSKTRYLYRDFKCVFGSPEVLEKDTKLYAFIDETDMSATDSLVEKVLEAGSSLRALSLQGSRCKLLSSPKYDLKNLRYLKLSRSDIEEVSDSVCTFYDLQTLDFSDCRSLSKLPTNMGNLINLRHLDTSGCDLITKMPPRMGNLKELRTLTHFALGKADGDEGCSSIKELGELPHLAGELHVRGLQNVETVEDAQRADFSGKRDLRKLVFEWEGEPSDTVKEWGVLAALRPHTDLEELTIRGYAASSYPKWVGHSEFSKMVSLTLEGSSSHNFCPSFPLLGRLPSLEKLHISSFNYVESIGSEFYGGSNSSLTPFPCLETLTFENMERWKGWSFAGNESFGYFPRLKQLQLLQCPSLGAESVPLGELASGLESLEIRDCRKMVEENGHWHLQRLTSLTSLTIRDETNSLALDSFPQGSLPTSLNSLCLDGFESLKTLDASAFVQLKFLKELVVHNCKELKSLPEKELPTSLSCLKIRNCRLLETRYQIEKGEHWDCIAGIRLIDIEGPTTDDLREQGRRGRHFSSSTDV